MIRFKGPASIQGATLTLKARRFNPYPPTRHEPLGFLVFKFKLSDNALAVIKKELSPKERFWPEKESLLNLGDGIQGEIIRGFSEQPLKPQGGVAGTAAHRAQGADTSEGRSFGELDRAYAALLKMKPKTPVTHQL
jgi:hypothetical protein